MNMDIRSLQYDKVKCILEFLPINVFNSRSSIPLDIVCKTISEYDHYVEQNCKGRKFFIPCYKTIGKFDETIFLQESIRPGEIEIPGNDDRKKIPIDLYGKFLQERKWYPSFFGYFNTVYDANRELNRKFKPWLERTVIVTERVKSFPKLYQKFKDLKFTEPNT